VFEFAGTMAMGRSVVSTIVGDITKTERFAKEPGEPLILRLSIRDVICPTLFDWPRDAC